MRCSGFMNILCAINYRLCVIQDCMDVTKARGVPDWYTATCPLPPMQTFDRNPTLKRSNT